MERVKNRKNKKIRIIVLLVLFMAVGVGTCYWYLPKAHAADESQEPVLEEGQEYVYAKITSILGNEIEYVIVDAQTVDFKDIQENGSEKKEYGGTENVGGEMQDAVTQNGEKPSAGEMPDMGGMPDMGSMPSAGGMPDMGSMPVRSNADTADGPGIQQPSVQNAADTAQDIVITTYTETDEAGQMQVPVGTEVETKLGTVTTFSRLSNGDIIKMLLQKDDTGNKELIRIWIME